MSVIGVGGQGIGLPYPSNTFINATTAGLSGTFNPLGGANLVALDPGDYYVLPSGTWLARAGKYSFIEWLDPVSGQWVGAQSTLGNAVPVNSDGYNYRFANRTGTAVGAIVTTAGSGYTSAPTVTASAGGSTWTALLGGRVGTITVGNDKAGNAGGTNFTLPPLVLFSAPPAGGVQATGYATISGGAVTSVTCVSFGAGYVSAPNITLVPNPLDPAIGSITVPAVTCVVTGAGTLSAILCTYGGSQITATPTLTISGGGGSAGAATVVPCFTVTGVTVGTAGATVAGSNVLFAGAGGYAGATASASGVGTPALNADLFPVRQMNAYAPVSGGSVGTPVIADGGLYSAVPSPLILQASGAAPGTAPAATFAVGGLRDHCWLQAVL